ncbi:hypothetical protein [[Flexibacter] sp. ATCC 35208]|uniref:hypothetical protein n=1 Tax=[Flexibacter] sp. ATCC 35208 TaxID=1936242 RepID=UPI00117D1DBC|nr:hypothetical protein [[Flexibacter] sp. ATCC 35208]
MKGNKISYLGLFFILLQSSCGISFFVPANKVVKSETGLILFYNMTKLNIDTMDFESRKYFQMNDSNLIGSLFFSGKLKDSIILKQRILNPGANLEAVELGRFCDMEMNFAYCDTLGIDSLGVYLTMPAVVYYVKGKDFLPASRVTLTINSQPVAIIKKMVNIHIVRVDPVTTNVFRNTGFILY